MKRFVIFNYSAFYPKGGMNDLIEVDFDEFEEAVAHVEKMVDYLKGKIQIVFLPDLRVVATGRIVDLNGCSVVWDREEE